MQRMAGKRDWGNLADTGSGYVLAIASTLTATAIRYAMRSELEEKSRLMLFIPAVLITSWYGGYGPGLFAVVLSIFLTAWLLIPPVTNINFGSRSDQVGMLLFVIISIGIIVLSERERSEKRRREVVQAELAEMNGNLEARVKSRTQELEQANKELEGFCYNVSHDLRTPARAIMGNARILIEDHADTLSEQAKQDLLRISGAALKLGALVDALLTYARLAQGEVRPEFVSISELMNREVGSRNNGRETVVNLTNEGDVIVYADRAMLSTAVAAIVQNCFTYSKATNQVTITLQSKKAGTDLLVMISDDGIGFEPQYAQKVLEPFQRLHRDEDYPGVGIGLANVARILERHGGQVWCESSPGTGTTVNLLFRNQPIESEIQATLLSA